MSRRLHSHHLLLQVHRDAVVSIIASKSQRSAPSFAGKDFGVDACCELMLLISGQMAQVPQRLFTAYISFARTGATFLQGTESSDSYGRKEPNNSEH